MSAKLVALALLLGAFGVVHALSPAPRDSADIADAAALLPLAAGEYRMSDRVSVPNFGSSAELAEYHASSGGAVLMGIMTNPQAHNAVGCYLARGEPLLSEQLRVVPTVGAPATFDVAFFREGAQLSLVANTECAGDVCRESLHDDWKAQWRHLDPRSPFLAQQPVVPVAVILTGDVAADGDAATQSRLLAEFERFAGQLDLEPMRRHAATR